MIYKAFCHPATGSFAWIGAEDAEIIYLNDFKWHPKIIAWAGLLLAVEGDTVRLPAPENLSSLDIELQCKVAHFPLLASNTSGRAARISALWSLFFPIHLGKHCEWRYHLN